MDSNNLITQVQECLETLSISSSGNNSQSATGTTAPGVSAKTGMFAAGVGSNVVGRSPQSAKSGGKGASSSSSSSDRNQPQHNQQYLNNASSSQLSGTGRVGSSVHRDVDEAVRRLGYRLSLQAHGGEETSATSRPQHQHASQVLSLSRTNTLPSSFEVYSRRRGKGNPMTSMQEDSVYDETDTTNFSLIKRQDDEFHENDASSKRIIQQITIEAKIRFQKWEHEHLMRNRSNSSRSSSTSSAILKQQQQTSPRHYALAQLGLLPPEESNAYTRQQHRQRNSDLPRSRNDSLSSLEAYRHSQRSSENTSSDGSAASGQRRQNSICMTAKSGNKGLLSAVMEGNSDSSTVSGARIFAGDNSILTTPSISTQASSAAMSHHTNNNSFMNSHTGIPSISNSLSRHHSHHGGTTTTIPEQEQETVSIRGKCLTTPAEATSNNGLDNVDGNLILYENDTLLIPRKNVRTASKTISIATEETQNYEYRVHALQGQGTFAQVFQCSDVATGKLVAVKIIKNKAAYTRHAAIEIDIFQALQQEDSSTASPENGCGSQADHGYMVNLLCFFMYRNHLCLVFELLGLNLYEVLKQRQFRGLPIKMVKEITQQAIEGIRDLATKNIVHCDLKPENILLINDDVNKEILSAGERPGEKKTDSDASSGSLSNDTKTTSASTETEVAGCLSKVSTAAVAGTDVPTNDRKIKLIDFGSACFEGYTAHTYIQSRFYRSPEVLIGLPYDSAIDMWSMGCVAAELFLGLPILPGVHEHDQVGRIVEMIAPIPNWMLDHGSKVSKYYTRASNKSSGSSAATNNNNNIEKTIVTTLPKDTGATQSPGGSLKSISSIPSAPKQSEESQRWRLKTQQEYINSLSQSEIRKKGGLARLQRQLGNRYFRRTKLNNILVSHAKTSTIEDKELLPAFIHFLYAVLDPDPWKRLTANQALQHPFLTGNLSQLQTKKPDVKKNITEEIQANRELNMYWEPPFDPTVYQRKLLNVQKMREKQKSQRGKQTGSGGSSMEDGSSDRRPPADNISEKAPAMEMQTVSALIENTRSNTLAPNISTPTTASISGSQMTSIGQHSQTVHLDSLGNTGSTYTTGTMPSWTDHSRIQSSQSSMPLSSNASAPYHAGVVSNDISLLPGARSLSGVGQYAGISSEVDFGAALQRPQIIPDGYSVTSQGTSTSMYQSRPSMGQNLHPYVAPVNTSTSYTEARTRNIGFNTQSVSLSSYGQSYRAGSQNVSSNDSIGNSSVQSSRYTSYSNQQYQLPQSPTLSTHGGSAYASVVPSTNTSVVMSDPSIGNYDTQQQLLLQQQQQQLMLQQQLEMQQLQLQQQQLELVRQQHQQYPTVQDQPPYGVVQQQQAPVYLTGGPGGGYYYVTTSAGGQPILLQAVGFFNQQQQQPLMNQQGGFIQSAAPHGMQQHMYGVPTYPVNPNTTMQGTLQESEMYNPNLGYGNAVPQPSTMGMQLQTSQDASIGSGSNSARRGGPGQRHRNHHNQRSLNKGYRFGESM
jgi:serine/threonine protein kinase